MENKQLNDNERRPEEYTPKRRSQPPIIYVVGTAVLVLLILFLAGAFKTVLNPQIKDVNKPAVGLDTGDSTNTLVK